MAKKIITLGVLAVMCLGLFTGCGGNKYNAVVVEDGVAFNTEFLKENMTYGAYYYNENYNEDIDDWSDRYLRDETSPKSREHIIKAKAEFDKIFTEFPLEVDFDKEMVLVYCYTDDNSRPRIIKSIELDDTTLKIKFKLKEVKPGVLDSTMPGRKCLVVKMGKLDITTAEFELLTPRG
jgi:hypothetical protein